MNVVDSSGWLEYLSDGANADFFAPLIEDEENLVTPTICIYEVFKRVLGELGEERALDAVGTLLRGNVVELSQQEAIEAARLSVQSKLAMADSIILATARAYQATLWTQDAHFKDIEGVRYIDPQLYTGQFELT
jgi:predicted nucleic acid-binding protein